MFNKMAGKIKEKDNDKQINGTDRETAITID